MEYEHLVSHSHGLTEEYMRVLFEGVGEILTRKSTCYVILYYDGVNDVLGTTGIETVPIGLKNGLA